MVEQEPPTPLGLPEKHPTSTKLVKRGKILLGKAVPWLSKSPRLAADRFDMNMEHPTTLRDRSPAVDDVAHCLFRITSPSKRIPQMRYPLRLYLLPCVLPRAARLF